MIFYLSYRIRRLRWLDRLLVLPMIALSMAFTVHGGWTHNVIEIGVGVAAVYLCARLHEYLQKIIQRLERHTYA